MIASLIGLIISGCGGARPSIYNAELSVTNYGNVENEKIKYKLSIPKKLPTPEILRYEYIGEILSNKNINNFVSNEKDYDYLLTFEYGVGNKIYTATLNIPSIGDLPRYAFVFNQAAFQQGAAQGSAAASAQIEHDNMIREQKRREALASRKNHFMNFYVFKTATKKLIYTSKINFSTSQYTFDSVVPIFINAFASTLGRNGEHKIDINKLRNRK